MSSINIDKIDYLLSRIGEKTAELLRADASLRAAKRYNVPQNNDAILCAAARVLNAESDLDRLRGRLISILA
jgi:hypothetical protein